VTGIDKKIPLGKLVTISSGSSPSSFNLNEKGKTPYIKVEDLNNCVKYQNESRLYTNDDGFKVPLGSVIFPKRGVAIMNNKVRIAGCPLFMDTNMMAITPSHQIMSEFLYYVILNEKLYRIADTSTIPQINNKHINPYKIYLPDLYTQKNIVIMLSTWDTAIEKNEKLIDMKTRLVRGLFQKLLFGKARLGRKRTTGITKKCWLQVPSDWAIIKIGAIAKEVNVRNQNGENIPVLSCTKRHGLVDSLKYFDKQIFSTDTSTYKVVERGQFAYATNHIEEGSIGYQDLYPQGLVSPMYTVFETDTTQVNNGFLYKLLKTETFRRIFAINTNASVDRRGGLRWQDFAKLIVPLPALDEQAEINEVLETAQREIDLLTKELELLKKQKRGLMQKLLTGEWRVKTGQEVT
jgi:type I restriction enzyme, S subunit